MAGACLLDGIELVLLQMFQARVSCAPDQVIRYCFKDGAAPLWPSPANLPALADVPPCKRCGAPRKFEFQVSGFSALQCLGPQKLNITCPTCQD